MKLFLSTVGMVCCWHTMTAQIPISSEANSFRTGDKLCKVQVDYVAPGDGGPNEVWPLGRMTKESQDFLQTIASARDTIAIFERGRIQHYLVHGDTLVDKGEQSRRAFCLYSQERPMLRYPFQYGDSLSGSFLGQGREENIKTSRSGWGYSVADGMGMLTDGEDTIPHIMRIHFFDEYTDTYYTGDTISFHIQCDRYSWYCAGYRYPIMESIRWATVAEGSATIPFDSVTYLFLPVMQMELAEDAVNDSILNLVAIADAANAETQASTKSALASINAGLSAGGTRLDISYTLDGESSIDFCACDILGNILGHAHYEKQEAGEWQECIVLNRKPISNVLTLNIKCGDNSMVIKIYR